MGIKKEFIPRFWRAVLKITMGDDTGCITVDRMLNVMRSCHSSGMAPQEGGTGVPAGATQGVGARVYQRGLHRGRGHGGALPVRPSPGSQGSGMSLRVCHTIVGILFAISGCQKLPPPKRLAARFGAEVPSSVQLMINSVEKRHTQQLICAKCFNNWHNVFPNFLFRLKYSPPKFESIKP